MKLQQGKKGLEDFIILDGCEPVQAPGNSIEECIENAKKIVKAVNNEPLIMEYLYDLEFYSGCLACEFNSKQLKTLFENLK